jgi:hypothetical protein
MKPIQKIIEIIYANNTYNILLRNNQEDEMNSKSTQVHHVWSQCPLNRML